MEDAVCGVPGGNRTWCCHSAHLGLPDWRVWGFVVYPWNAAFFTWAGRGFSSLPPSQLQPLPFSARAPDKFKPSPKASNPVRVTQFTMPWESPAFGNCSVRSHWLFVICSRHVLNVSLVPRQSPDLRVRWQHQPHKLYFGSTSQSRIMLTHEFSKRALGSSEGWERKKWG